MRKQLTGLQYVALGLGTGWLGLQTMMLLEHAGEATTVTKLLVPAATITLAALPVLIEHTLEKRQWAGSAVLAVLFALLLAYSLPYSIARSGEHRDAKNATLVAYQTAVEKADKAKAAADKECKTGNGPRCKDLRAEQAKAEAKVPEQPPVGNADAVRVASVLNIDVATYEKFQPMALPLANELAVWALLWLGLSPSMMVAAGGRKVPAKAPAKRRKAARKPATKQGYFRFK